ncbi:MAG: T9SS type A sorting domain-containing protein [Bacteroidales bacterium]|nr:T9SS type A sorting domain-containing protein [Bacteroidales bacterium]MCF8457106.1 T9SS type A sorting domain-containing protein [Bacteroidales bacterium]
MNPFLKTLLSAIFLSLIYFEGTSQISQKAPVTSTVFGLETNIPFVLLPSINHDSLLQADALETGLKALRFASMIPCNIDVKENAKEDKVATGTLWRLGIVSENALSLYTEFSSFELPEGAMLFLYNPRKNHILGAFTHLNNKTSKKFAVLPIIGDSLIIEYFEPTNIASSLPLVLGQIGHDYRGIIHILENPKDGSFGHSGSCNIDINCFEGNDWQRDKKAVCRIIANGALCSGALVNNTNHDARPFFLTANHCVSNQAAADNMICVFNYESPSCNGLDGSVEQAISGGIMRATATALDFCLVELSSAPLPSFQPYFAGWNHTDSPSRQSTSIHHPQGDVKKISKDYDPTVTDTYLPYDANAHWRIADWDLGTTEGGSSGSPLFDQDHRIIGSLTGGEAYCGHSVNDYYAKFAKAWDSYPEANKQLNFWLDPSNTGATYVNGYDPYYGQTSPIANFTANRKEVLVGGTVDFTDLSEGNVTSWEWHFSGAVPSTSTEQHPTGIKYTYPGTFMIQLVVENAYGNHQLSKYEYITVGESCARITNIEDEDYYLFTFSGGYWGYWTGHNEYQFTEFAEKYTNQSGHYVHGLYILPAKSYSSNPSAIITVKIYDGGASPGTVLRQQNILINSISANEWKYLSFDPAIETSGNFFAGIQIYYNGTDTFAVPHSEPRGANGLNTTYIKESGGWQAINESAPEMTISLAIEPYICGSLIGIEKENPAESMRVFPNPASNFLMVDLPDSDTGPCVLQIINSTGQILLNENLNHPEDIFRIDIAHFKPGIYFIKIIGEENVLVRSFVKM